MIDLGTQIGHITIVDLLFMVLLFGGVGFGAFGLMERHEKRSHEPGMVYGFTRRALIPWWVYAGTYITANAVLGAHAAFIVVLLYLAFTFGSAISYGQGRRDGASEPERIAKMIEAQLARDWPGVVAQEAARAARDN
jgi:cbb3-type cytochrome oxidase subunit 1